MQSIGSRIRKFRKAAGMSQYQLADAVGVTQPAVWCWERGRHNGKPVSPRLEKLAAIAKALGVSIDDLMSDKKRAA